MATASELSINTSASATQMAEEIFGDGVTVVGASYTGSGYSSGIYSGGDTTSPGVTPGDSGVILSTGQAQDFTNAPGGGGGGGWWGWQPPTSNDPNQSTNTSTNTYGVDNDADFNAVVGANTYDASFLDVDFVPTGDTMTMQFVFSSEEYPEYVNSIYNDAVVVWVNGEPVELAVSDSGTDVGSVNSTNNENLYIDNTGDAYNTEMDGFTVTMTLTMPVNAGEVNSIRIGIADVGDSSYDSNLLIAGDSVQTAVIANLDEMDIAPGGTKVLDVLENDTNSGPGTLTITHINGVPVSAGDSVTLTTGQVITLNADGTFDVTTDLDEEEVSFTYTVENDTGTSDVGFVTVNTVPCFVAGTLILTDRGKIPVEDLEPGDMVMTLDDGPQPLRWTGRRAVAAKGRMAPIRILANTFGNHDTLLVSPQHRVLLRDGLAELLFGAGEVLVAAKDLVNDRSVRVQEGGSVDYVHLLFDRHQIIWSAGLTTESFLPGPQTTKVFEHDIVAEICAIFPELDPDTGKGYSPAARRTLRRYEAQVLLQRAAA
ncbi:Hint domain-containing protein [Actibacterium sp. D379-3]